MLNLLFAQAAVNGPFEGKQPLEKGGLLKSISPEITIVLVAIAVVGALLLIWAVFIRKRPKEVLGSRVLSEPDKKSQRYGSSGRRRHRKRRPTHPDNLGRRPTLAETGGLPPLRSDEPPSPSAANRPPEGFSPPV